MKKTETEVKPFSTAAAISKAMTEPVTVEACGLRFKLIPPSAGDTLEVRKELMERFDGIGEDPKVLAEASHDATIQALSLCLGDLKLSKNVIRSLAVRSGGEAGDLCRTAMALCGLLMGPAKEDDSPL